MAIFFYQCLYKFNIIAYIILIPIVSVYKNKQMFRIQPYLCALVITCWSSDSTFCVPIYRQMLYINHAASYTFIRFVSFTDTERKSFTNKFICIKSTYTIAIHHRREIDQID